MITKFLTGHKRSSRDYTGLSTLVLPGISEVFCSYRSISKETKYINTLL